MTSLIDLAVIDGEPRVDSRLIADQLGVQHQNFRELIQDYQPDFEEFGILRFETGEIKGRGQPEKYVLLNEDQSYLGLTYTKNTPQARELKKRLVRSFAEHRRAMPHAQPAADPDVNLGAELAELLRGKILVDQRSLVEMVRGMQLNVMRTLMNDCEPIEAVLDQGSLSPLTDLLGKWRKARATPKAAPPKPIPDYQRILDAILIEIEQRAYPYPHALREIDGIHCLLIRTRHIMMHLRNTDRLKKLYQSLKSTSDRILKSDLRKAGLIVQMRTGPVIDGQRMDHAVAIRQAVAMQQGLALH